MADFKDRLEEALRLRNVTAAELSRKGRINEGTLSQYRKGAYKASQENLLKISRTLNVSLDWLMGANVPMAPAITSKGVKIPVLGIIRAGIPIDAIEEILGYEEIPPSLAQSGRFYALRVTGNSMAPRISAGDIVIVRQQKTVESGAVAIVLVNGNEATVKEIRFENNSISLIPWNAAYRPQFFTAAQVQALPVEIIGKVVEIRGKLE